MSAIQNLEDLFIQYQRLNQILKDNWNDSTQEAFDGNYLVPIATEWSLYHSSVSDMKARVRSTAREIDADLDDLQRELNAMSGPVECELNGDMIYGVRLRRDNVVEERHLIIPVGELNYIEDSDICFMAMGRFPSYEDYESPHSIERISIY